MLAYLAKPEVYILVWPFIYSPTLWAFAARRSDTEIPYVVHENVRNWWQTDDGWTDDEVIVTIGYGYNKAEFSLM